MFYENEEFFYKRLIQLRTEKGISAREMSLAIGQNEAYINRIENHKSLPSMTGFLYICDYLDVTPEEFWSVHAPDKAIIDATKKLLKLSPQTRNHILAIIDDL